MAVPDFQSLMLPLLRMAADGCEHSLSEARDVLAAEFHLSAADLEEPLPSGRQPPAATLDPAVRPRGLATLAGKLSFPAGKSTIDSDPLRCAVKRVAGDGSAVAGLASILRAPFRTHGQSHASGLWRVIGSPEGER